MIIDPYAIKLWLRVLRSPSCWGRLHPYSEAWDRRLQELMREYRFERCSRFTARLGPATVWIANHPYASMSPAPDPEVLPSRRTVFMAHDKLIAETSLATSQALP